MRKNFEPAADYDGLRRQYEAITKLHSLTCDELADSVEREKKALAAMRQMQLERYQPSALRSALQTTWHWLTAPYRLGCIIVAGLWFCITGGWWRKDDNQ